LSRNDAACLRSDSQESDFRPAKCLTSGKTREAAQNEQAAVIPAKRTAAEPHEAMPERKLRRDASAHPDQLRHDIDRGHTGDKVAFPDPAAAPLGTDEEAAGTPVPGDVVARARDVESGRPGQWRIPRWCDARVWFSAALVLVAAVLVAAAMLRP
jgi:hypothetical protein